MLLASVMPPNAGKQANELSVDEELLCSSVRSVTLLPHNVLDTILERYVSPRNLASERIAPKTPGCGFEISRTLLMPGRI